MIKPQQTYEAAICLRSQFRDYKVWQDIRNGLWFKLTGERSARWDGLSNRLKMLVEGALITKYARKVLI